MDFQDYFELTQLYADGPKHRVVGLALEALTIAIRTCWLIRAW
jgi:hypothetical protein